MHTTQPPRTDQCEGFWFLKYFYYCYYYYIINRDGRNAFSFVVTIYVAVSSCRSQGCRENRISIPIPIPFPQKPAGKNTETHRKTHRKTHRNPTCGNTHRLKVIPIPYGNLWVFPWEFPRQPWRSQLLDDSNINYFNIRVLK